MSSSRFRLLTTCPGALPTSSDSSCSVISFSLRRAPPVVICASLFLSVSFLPADRQVIERRDRIRLRPQANATRREARVAMVEMQRAVEPRLDMVAQGDETHGVPAAEGGCFHARGRELSAPALVVVEAEVVVERIGPDDVVLPLVEAE